MKGQSLYDKLSQQREKKENSNNNQATVPKHRHFQQVPQLQAPVAPLKVWTVRASEQTKGSPMSPVSFPT
jgi:hypothetical protein